MASTREQMLEAQRQAEAYFFEWTAGREKLQSQYEAAEKNEEFEYRKAIESVEADFQRSMRVAEAGGPQSLDMLQQVMVDKRNLKLKVLENEYRETRSKMQTHFDKQLLEHAEKFSQGIIDKLTPVAQFNPTQLSTLSASRLPPSTGQSSTLPFYQPAPLGSNGDSRFSVPDHGRHPPQSGPFRGGDYALYNAQPMPYREGDYARHSGQPKTQAEYSTSAGPERHPAWTSALHSDIPGDARVRHPLPSHQKILPSTPIAVEPERVIDPLNTTYGTKRKSDTQVDGQSQEALPKRTRSFGAHGFSEKTHIFSSERSQDHVGIDKAKPPTPRPTQKTSTVKRTIDFNEVYQDGDAEYKHMIIRYPPGDDGKGDWWILKCDEHGVHFNTNPLHGAAKHLHSNQHNNMSKEHALAIRELGHMVWDCNKALADKNNEAVKLAFEKGYKPFNRNQLTKTERRSMGFTVHESIPARRMPSNNIGFQRKKVTPDLFKNGPSKEFTGVVYPVDAELYLGYWSKNKTRYVVMLLPWGDLDSTGIEGNLMSTGLLERPPKCYTIDRATREITGWAEGFEDGGRFVTKREFPVMYFDGSQSVGWLRAKDLSLFNFEDPDPQDIPYYYEARDRYANAQPQKFGSYRQMKDYYAANGLPPKLFSSVRRPSPSFQMAEVGSTVPGADNASIHSVGKVHVVDMDGDMSPRLEGPVKVNGHLGPVDVEMHDMSRVDDTESYHDSAPSDIPESDEDVDMGDAERLKASLPTIVSGKHEEPFATAAAGKQTVDPAATGSDIAELAALAYARAPEAVSPWIKESVENAGHDKDKGKVPAVVQDTENATITLKDPVDHVTNGGTNGTYSRSESELSSSSDSNSRRVVKIHAGRPRSARATESPSVAAASLPTPNDAASVSAPSPRTEDSIVHKGLAPMEAETTVDELRTDTLEALKSPVASVPQIETSTSHSKQPTPLDASNARSSHEPNQVESVISAHVTVAAPAPTSKMSDSSSAISSPRSTSPTPVAAATSRSSSRTSTPTVLRADEMAQTNRWRAVRGESGPQVVASPQPQQSPGVPSSASPATSASKEPSKEASISSAGVQNSASAASRTGTPLSGRMAAEDLFEIAYYEDDSGGKFHKLKDGPFLRLVVDKQANTCGTSPGQSTEVKINPRDIARVDVNPLDDSPGAPCMLSLELKDEAEGPKKQQLVFETSKAMGREEHGRIHARRFCAWVKRANAAIDYRNHTYNSNRPATSYTRS